MTTTTHELIAEARRVFADEPMPLAACLRLRELAAAAADYKGDLLPDSATYLSMGGSLDDEFLATVLAGEELGGWALAASSIGLISEFIHRMRPNTVLEFGSGRSTVALAHLMRTVHEDGVGTRVISIDQSSAYLEETRKLLERASLSSLVRLVHAPLRTQSVDGHQTTCYDLADLLANGTLQRAAPALVVVDGPFGGYGARFGTVPLVHGVLAEGAVIVMDDALRDSELAIAKWWEDLGYVVGGGVVWNGKGTYLASKGRRPPISLHPAGRAAARELLAATFARHIHTYGASGNFGLRQPFAWSPENRSGVGSRPGHSISVVIPAFNRAAYLEQAVRSALSQDGIFEVIVVDDGSTDGSPEVVERIQDGRLRLVRKLHSGGPATRNHGIAEARGEFILWVDSDDCLAPGTVEAYLEELAFCPEVDVLYGDLIAFDEQGLSVRIRYPDYRGHPNLEGLLLRGNILPNPGTLVRRRLYDLVGNYDEAFRRAHDYEFWSRAAARATFRHIDRVVCHWRLHDGPSLSGDCATVDKSFEARVVRKLAASHSLEDLLPDLGWADDAVRAEASAHGLIADLLLGMLDLDGAREALHRGLALAPDDPANLARGRRVEAAERVAMAERAHQDGDVDRAERELTAALLLDPASASAHNDLGVVMLHRGDSVRALGCFVESLKREPLGREAVLNCVRLLASIGREGDATAICDHYLANVPLDREMRRLLGEVGANDAGTRPPSGDAAVPEAPAAVGPLVSVIVTTKDRPALLPDALHSLVSQTYANWEAVVVNDGGEDVAAAVAAIDPRQRIRYLRHPCSRGVSAARNTGISFSTGDVLCYLDDDDRFMPRHLETVIDALQRSAAELVYAEAEYVSEAVKDGRRVEMGRSRPFAGVPYSMGRLHVSNFIPVNTWAHRRELLARTGGFDTTLCALEDWDLLLRFCRIAEPVQVDAVTVEVRQRPLVQGEHLCQRERAEFPALYREIYRRYPVDFEPALDTQRQRLLEQFEAGATATPAELAGLRPARSYEQWVARHSLKESDAQYMAERMVTEWRHRPTFHLLVAHRPDEEEALADTLDGIATQLYRNWGLTVVSECSAHEGWTAVPNVEWLQVDVPVMEGVNAVAEQSPGDWAVLLRPGARLAPDALFAWADRINLHDEWRLIYADEDRLDADGNRHSPAFKPDVNPELLRSLPYVGEVLAVRVDLLRAAGGYDLREGAAAYGLALRALELAGAQAIGHVPRVLVHAPDGLEQQRDPVTAIRNRQAVLVEHLERCGEAADVSEGIVPGTHFVDYRLCGSERVSVVVPHRRDRGSLGACVDGLLSRTRYPDYEVVVVTEVPPAELPSDAKLRVLGVEPGLSLAQSVNRGVAAATGDLVVLLHDDCLVVQESWLTRLVAIGQRAGVGIVGARLVDADQRVSHAGLVLGLTGTVGRVGAGASLVDPGYLSRLQVAQCVSAVSGACLLIGRSLFEQVGGLDAERFPELFADADLCLRVASEGLQVIWTPFVTLVGSSLPRDCGTEAAAREKEELHARWLPRLADDPAFNPSLSLFDKAVSVETELDVTWDRPFHPRPRIWAFPLDDQGVGHYRVRAPLAALDQATLAQVDLLPMHERTQVVRVPNLPELVRAAPDTVLIQHGYLDLFLDWIPRYRKHTDAFVVFGQDDNMFEVPEKNANRGRLASDIERRVAAAMALCDRLVVTTEPLAEVYRRFAADIRVVPNHIDAQRWRELHPLRRQGRRPRVGWAGAQQHLGDLDWLEPVVRSLADEVEWVFMGMCPDVLRPFVAEFHGPVPFSRYPAKLASLNLDLAIAPLEVHPFNECKSDLRLLEYGALGWPAVATDIHPFRGKPVTLLPNDPKRWIAAIRERIHDLDALAAEGDRLEAWVLRHRLLENNLGSWFQALFDDALLRRLGAAPGIAA